MEVSVKIHKLVKSAKYVSNRVRLALFVLAYNLGNFLRRFALPSQVAQWSLTSIQLKLIKIGAKIVSHSRMTVFQMAEVAVPGATIPVDATPEFTAWAWHARGRLPVKDGDRKQGGFKCGMTVP